MTTARVFKTEDTQVIHLPLEFQIDADEVEVFRRGDEIVLKAKPRNLSIAFELLAGMPEDFMAEGRDDDPLQEREQW
jgi:antitoxin VapB